MMTSKILLAQSQNRSSFFLIRLSAFFILIILFGSCYAQDTLISNDKSLISSKSKVHSAKRASWYSAVLPGLGQAYNKKYWKIPIVYGIMGAFGFYAVSNGDLYQVFLKASIYRTDNDPATIDDFDSNYPELCYNDNCPKLTDAALLEAKNFYRKKRDLNYMLLLGTFVFNIIDATVDAHFFDFDISDDLSLTIDPKPIFALNNQISPGLRLRVKL